MVEKIKVGIIFGGRSGEHEVSLNSARSILSTLSSEKYEIIQIGISKEGRWFVQTNPQQISVLDALVQENTDLLTPVTMIPDSSMPGLYLLRKDSNNQVQLELFDSVDVIFPILHGTFGEDGTLQGLMELSNLAYVGAGVVGSAVGMDKGIFKDVMRAHDIPIVDWCVVTRQEIENSMADVIEKVMRLATWPLFVKPANLGSSVGITKCINPSDLMEGLLEAARFDRRVIVECGVSAREIEISILGNEYPIISVPGEIIPSREFYSYEAKYVDNASELIIPAKISAEMTKTIQELALQAYQAIDCAGMARVDFLLDKENGEIYLSEVNTIPGFTTISMYPKLWEASGMHYGELVDRLIELARERQAERQRTIYKYD